MARFEGEVTTAQPVGRPPRHRVVLAAAVLTGLALVVGLPIGVALGRVAWTAFADDLGAAGGPRVPLLVLLAAAAGLLLLANAIGEWPARAAARRPLEAWAADQRAGGSTGA
jgi:hypothetical protein